MSTPTPDSPKESPAVPPDSVSDVAFSGLARVLVFLIRIVGIIIVIGGAIVIRFTAKNNPGIALAMAVVLLIVALLVWTISSFLRMLARDAAREVPSKSIGIIKLVLGTVTAVVFLIGADINMSEFNPLPFLSFGVLPASKYGPLWAGIYGVFVAFGVLGMISGLLALLGQRLPTLAKPAIVLLVLAGCTLAGPAMSPVRLVRTIQVQERLAHVHFSIFAYSPDGQRVAAGTSYGAVRIFDTGTGLQTLQVPSVSGSNSHAAIAWSPDGQRLATVTESKTRMTDAATGKELFTSEGGGATAIAFSADGQRLVCVGPDFVCTRDASSGKETGRFTVPKMEYTPKPKVAISRDGTRVAVAAGRYLDKLSLKVWDASTGAEIMAPDKLTDEVQSLALSPDGKFLATGGGGPYSSYDPGRVLIWDLATGKQTLSLPTETKQVAQLAYSSDGRHLAAISNYRTVVVWDAQTGQVSLVFQSGDLGYDWLAFAPEGGMIATASGFEDFIQFWDVSRGLPSR